MLKPLSIGPYRIENPLFVAPMAGVTDKPFRVLCKSLGAGHAVSEMLASNTALYARKKSLFRADFDGEITPISAQIAGADPAMMIEASKFQLGKGAQIIDINMGCPAKKVCKRLAGSALLADLDQVRRILDEVVAGVDAPVTLKTRLGYEKGSENILKVAQIAEQAGIAALAIHGRTRDQFYTGVARYELIRKVKQQVSMPIIVNGDIDSPQKAQQVLKLTGADGIMVGRAAQGAPWIFGQIAAFLESGELVPDPDLAQMHQILLGHLQALYAHYGEYSGCRIARKHIAWYTGGLPDSNRFRAAMYELESTASQFQFVDEFFEGLSVSAD